MPTYKYRAKKGPNNIVEEFIEAPSEKEAVEKISHLGYLPVRVEEYSRPIPAPSAEILKRPSRRIPTREITVFSRQLASLLKSAVPILSSIDIIAEQSESGPLKAILYEMRDAIKDGATLSSALARYPKIFSPLYISLIRTGEDSGALPEALLRIADYRAKQDEMMSRFRMALAYPALMAVVGLGTIIFMFAFVMPRLMGIFANMGQALPLPTRILISISKNLRQWWLLLIVALAILVSILVRYIKTNTGRMAYSRLKLRLPILGKLILKAELGRFSRTLELLLKNGISILKAIELSIPVLGNDCIKEQLAKSYKELEQGGSFGRSLKASKLFPLFMTNLIIVGEESGKLDEALGELANSYERDTDEALRATAGLLEPLMILTMGLIVGFIVVAMLLPIFEINVMAK